MTLLADYAALLADGLRTVLTTRGPQRWRRLGFLLLFVTVWPLWVGLSRLCLLLDPLLFPASSAPLEAPVFIVGNHRTGSTHLQRLLASDPETFSVCRLVDLLLPSLVQRRLAGLLGRLDARIGAPGRRLLERLDGMWGQEYRKIHSMGLWLPEEDEFFLLYTLGSGALWECFPRVQRFRRLFWSDSDMPRAEQDRAMRFYRSVAQRHHHQAGRGIWLSKNPLFSSRVGALRRAFPDARFVVLVRDPRRVVPSTASLIHHAQRAVGALPPDGVEMDTIHEICTRFYDEPLEHLAGLPPEQLAVVRCEDMRADPVKTITGMLDQLNVPISDTLREAIAASKTAPSKATHRYTLGEWGLTEAGLLERYAEVARRYGYGPGAE